MTFDTHNPQPAEAGDATTEGPKPNPVAEARAFFRSIIAEDHQTADRPSEEPKPEQEEESTKYFFTIYREALHFEVPRSKRTIDVPLSGREIRWLLRLTQEPQAQGFNGLARLLVKLDDYGLAGLVYRDGLDHPWYICTTLKQLKANHQGTTLYQVKLIEIVKATEEIAEAADDPNTEEEEEEEEKKVHLASGALPAKDLAADEIYAKDLLNHTILNEATKQTLVIIAQESLNETLSKLGYRSLAEVARDKDFGRRAAEKLGQPDIEPLDTRSWKRLQRMQGITRYLSDEAREAIQLLVTHHMRYFYEATRRNKFQPKIVSDMVAAGRRWDLIQSAAEAFHLVILRLDLGLGNALTTYAHDRIHQAVSRASEQAYEIRLPVWVISEIAKLQRLRPVLTQQLGEDPRPEDYAIALLEMGLQKGSGGGIRTEDVQALRAWYHGEDEIPLPASARALWKGILAEVETSLANITLTSPLSLNLPIDGAEDESRQLGDVLPDQAAPVSQRSEAEATRQEIDKALALLNLKEEIILRIRFGLPGRPLNLEQLMEIFSSNSSKGRLLRSQKPGSIADFLKIAFPDPGEREAFQTFLDGKELFLPGQSGSMLTLEEVGALFGVTRERIRQIEFKAIRKLMHPSRRRELGRLADRWSAMQ